MSLGFFYNNGVALSVYIHVPFCRTKCVYCDFYSVTDLTATRAYHDSLLKEIQYHAKDVRCRDETIDTVFFGGGTPSLSSPAQVDRIVKALWKQFEHTQYAELTLEANPDDLTDQIAERWRDCGINRISLGVQSFRDSELVFLGRRHSSAAVDRASDLLRSHDFRNISFDLIYGVPGQTLESWRESLMRATELCPEHLSAYCLTVESGTPLHGMIARREVNLPDDELLRDMFFLTIETLTSSGYHQYEISNFALPGFECRHNLAYWTGRSYLGLGAAAASYFHPARWKNISDLSRYIAEVNSTGCAIGEAEALDAETMRREYVMLSLRLTQGLDCVDYAKKFGEDIRKTRSEIIGALIANGMMKRYDGHLTLTPAGMFVSDEIVTRLT